MLVAVEQAGVLADHLVAGVAAHPGECGIDRKEAELRIQHRHRFGHVAHYFDRDAVLAFQFAHRIDVARSAGHLDGTAVGVAFDGAAMCAQPMPALAIAFAAETQVDLHHRRVPAQIGAQLVEHTRQVVGMDLGVAVQFGTRGQVVVRIGENPGAFQVMAAQVVLPIQLARCPQREA